MDSRLRGNDKERSIATQSWVPVILTKRSPSFPPTRESTGHHSDPHWGSLLESTEHSMPGPIFSGASNKPQNSPFLDVSAVSFLRPASSPLNDYQSSDEPYLAPAYSVEYLSLNRK